jgi:type III secretion protein N (ATPase)
MSPDGFVPPYVTPPPFVTASPPPAPRRRRKAEDGVMGVRLRLIARIKQLELRPASARVAQVGAQAIRCRLDHVAVGQVCELVAPGGGSLGRAQVVGFEEGTAILLPYGETTGVSSRTEVVPLPAGFALACAPDMLGTLIDPTGEVLQRFAQPARIDAAPAVVPLAGRPRSILDRRSVTRSVATGIRAIDGLICVGEGQRVGIFGPPATGKSSLVSKIIAGTDAQVIVLGLVGERGREVSDFIASMRGVDALAKCVVVATTSDRSALQRLMGASAATSVAEYFRDAGYKVLLLIDSVTRVARAAREIGLAMGEPPGRRGFPPSVFAMLPKLFERAGVSERGSITAFYTVLSEGDVQADPIVDECKSLLDGHIVLCDKLAGAGRFPAIDILRSASRSMAAIVDPAHAQAATQTRSLLAALKDVELLRRIGEYKEGADALVDRAIRLEPQLHAYLAQGMAETTSFADAVAQLDPFAS